MLLCIYSRTGGSFAASGGISCKKSHGFSIRCHVEHLQGWWVRDVKGSHLRRVGLWKNCGSLGRCGLRQVSSGFRCTFAFTFFIHVFNRRQQLFLTYPGRHYLTAGLLTNLHTCLSECCSALCVANCEIVCRYGSLTSAYFGIKPPSADDYFV